MQWCIFRPGKDIVWEHGNNREVAGAKGFFPGLQLGIRSSHVIWHLEPINHYSTFYEGKLLWQQQRKIDDAFSVYVDYLLNVFQTENWTVKLPLTLDDRIPSVLHRNALASQGRS